MKIKENYGTIVLYCSYVVLSCYKYSEGLCTVKRTQYFQTR